MFQRDFITCTRAMLEDVIHVRWRDIRAITGAVGGPQGGQPEIIEGASTLYMEGELGFVVNHTADELFAMIEAAQVTN